MTNKIYISCVSWEERFAESLKFNLEKNEFDCTISFFVDEFSELSKNGLQRRVSIIDDYPNSEHDLVSVSTKNDVETWKKVSACVKKIGSEDQVVLDVSTMPRYLIWFALHFLQMAHAGVKFVYCSPKSYCKNNIPLTREPLEPRLILKHSGIFLPGRNTVLIVQIGFDYDRLMQLIVTYEPEKIILAIQEGEQFDNANIHKKESSEKLGFSNFEYVPIDAFDNRSSYSLIEQKILDNRDEKNIILASMGPKLMTLIMYRLNQKYPDTGLVDVPVGQYDPNYSQGADCDKMISLDVDF